jgi:hypothetical protein
MSENDRTCYVAFSVSGDELRELKRLARRLAYPNVQPLAVELVKLGLAALEDRYELETAAGRFLKARERVHVRDETRTRSRRDGTRRTPMPAHYEG